MSNSPIPNLQLPKVKNMIEDQELREVFKIASEEHLQKLDEGFLHLEKHPSDSAKLEELLREAHSLKGDAGMLGVKNISTLAHQLEHVLNAIKRGEQEMSPEISDRFSQALDALRKLVQEAVTGEASGINTFYVLANLMGSQNSEVPARPEATPKDISIVEDAEDSVLLVEEVVEDAIEEVGDRQNTSDKQENIAPTIPAPMPTASTQKTAPPPQPVIFDPTARIPQQAGVKDSKKQESAYRIETIRVATRNLDSLMTQAGELTVTKIRLAHRMTEIEEITKLWEEWSRDLLKNRFVFDDIDKQNGAAIKTRKNGAIAQLQNYNHRTEDRLELFGSLINSLRNSILEDTARLDLISNELEAGIRTLRLLPLSTIFNLFPRMVRDLARQEDKQIELLIEGGETLADKRILEEMKDPLMHIIRNAIDHGIETPQERKKLGKLPLATIRLRGYQTATNIVIEVIDDGRGLDSDRIKETAIKRGICTEEELGNMTINQIQSLIFAPGFSTRNFVTEVSGRGVGLDVVRTNVEALKGTIEVESTPDKGCLLRVELSTSLATAHVLIVAVNGVSYALPLESVQTNLLVARRDIFTIEGREAIAFDNRPLSVVKLADLLEVPVSNSQLNLEDEEQIPCVVFKVGEAWLGLFVDELVDEQDVVLKPQSKLLKRVRNVAGATILGTGEVCILLNPQDLIRSVRNSSGVSQRLSAAASLQDSQNIELNKKPAILLAEDSIATRTQEKRILENAGYEVVTAVDGLDALKKLKTRFFDAVISDVQMPNFDGLSLTAKIRENKDYSELPIILVTSLASDDDKKRGADAGANAYITKGTFNQDVLLETLKRLV